MELLTLSDDVADKKEDTAYDEQGEDDGLEAIHLKGYGRGPGEVKQILAPICSA